MAVPSLCLQSRSLGISVAAIAERFQLSLSDARLREAIHCAFQRIVIAQFGEAYGFEVLLQGFDTLGFASPRALHDHAYTLGQIAETDHILRDIAFGTFAAFAADMPVRLFFSMDDRALYYFSFHINNDILLQRHNLSEARFCIEFSEARGIASVPAPRPRLVHPALAFPDRRFWHRLFQPPPAAGSAAGFHKDRCFIAGSDTDRARKAFLAQLVKLADPKRLGHRKRGWKPKRNSAPAAMWKPSTIRTLARRASLRRGGLAAKLAGDHR
jgi:hypothetical protein